MLQAQQILQGRYQLHRQLGNNAGRQTWLAKDLNVQSPRASLNATPVIIKLLAFSPQMQWEELKLFEREAQVLKQLNHVRIPQYRDYFSIDKEMGAGLHWFALVHDYIPGFSLQQLLDRGERFSESQVRSIATGILEILIYLHELNPPVLHRDIKPSNLILGKDKQIYLVDFGAVQDPVAAEGVTFTVVGTAGYAPLEQFWGRAVPASDLSAAGATFIHLLAGTAPADLPQNNLRIQFRERVSINPTFINWIETLTEPDLTRRFSTASQALEVLKSGNYLKIAKPAGSTIKISKSSTHLYIQIPKQKLSRFEFIHELIQVFSKLIIAGTTIFFQLSIGLLFFLGLIVFFHDFALASYIVLISCIIVIPWIKTNQEIWNLFSELKQVIAVLLGQNSINFIQDKVRINIEWRILSHQGKFFKMYKVSDIKDIRVIPSQGMILETKNEQYSLAKHLSEPELLWLAQEIKDWLR